MGMTFLWILAACLTAPAAAGIVDMTHVFATNKTWSWPGNQQFSTENEFAGEVTAGGTQQWYESEEYVGATHGGTHMDAPLHIVSAYSPKYWTVEQIPPERFIAPLRIINVQDHAANNHGYQLQISDLARHEKQHGRIPDQAVVVMKSGWGKHWPIKERYFGPNHTHGDLLFPGFSSAAADWLLKHREPYGIGVDTASVDAGNILDAPVHKKIAASNVYGLENLANVDKVPEAGATIFAFPMKIEQGSGAPCRVVAMWGESRDVIGGGSRLAPSVLSLLVVGLLALY